MAFFNHHLKPPGIQHKHINLTLIFKDRTQHILSILQLWNCLSHHAPGQQKDVDQATNCKVPAWYLFRAKLPTTED
jgi:hypothetical protein